MSLKTPPPAIDTAKVQRALLSVFDKTGLVELATRLSEKGVELISTGGTAKAIREAGLPVKDVSDVTGFPEMMDGRVKTLHPKIHGGLLGVREDAGHMQSAKEHDILSIDLVVINLYPFSETVRRTENSQEIIENIDIGGPAMIRSAAKNHRSVLVVTDPADYSKLVDALGDSLETSLDVRRAFAAKAFRLTAHYDSEISTWFARQEQDGLPKTFTGTFPETFSISGRRSDPLRYGENPHMAAAFYKTQTARPGVMNAQLRQGKQLSYNNINDADAAFELVCEFDRHSPACAIIKHANPCGAARADTLLSAYELAQRCDPVSAFGGIIALNQEVDEKSAQAITSIFTEAVIAPAYTQKALEIFARKPNIRVLETGALADPLEKGVLVKSLIGGGLLVQDRDSKGVDPAYFECVTKRKPTEQETADMVFAFQVAKHVKSNAIVYVKDGATVGIGAGQMSRVDSSRIAAHKSEVAAKEAGLDRSLSENSVVASDAFFPFADGLLAAAKAGATAVIQPGGSKNDQAVIEAADEAGLAMVFTGQRHFRH